MKHLVQIIARTIKPKAYKINRANGVTYDKAKDSYRVRLITGKINKHLGYFKQRWDAICEKQSYINTLEQS